MNEIEGTRPNSCSQAFARWNQEVKTWRMVFKYFSSGWILMVPKHILLKYFTLTFTRHKSSKFDGSGPPLKQNRWTWNEIDINAVSLFYFLLPHEMRLSRSNTFSAASMWRKKERCGFIPKTKSVDIDRRCALVQKKIGRDRRIGHGLKKKLNIDLTHPYFITKRCIWLTRTLTSVHLDPLQAIHFPISTEFQIFGA